MDNVGLQGFQPGRSPPAGNQGFQGSQPAHGAPGQGPPGQGPQGANVGGSVGGFATADDEELKLDFGEREASSTTRAMPLPRVRWQQPARGPYTTYRGRMHLPSTSNSAGEALEVKTDEQEEYNGLLRESAPVREREEKKRLRRKF